MKRLFLTLLVAVAALMANAKTNVDFSSKCNEGTNTITATSAWGWYSVQLSDYEVADAEYLYIEYESSCSFNLILQDAGWQNAYSVKCTAEQTEGYIKLEPGKYEKYSCVVIQNRVVGDITIKKLYFCSEEEFYNPKPEGTEEAMENLVAIYLRYQPLQGTLPVGDGYGQYPADLYQAFSDALDAALVLDTDEGAALTADELNAIAQAIVDAYKALMAAKHEYLPADGYYRFVCARQFQTGDEEQNITYLEKALYSSNTGANGWKTLDQENPTFLWHLEQQPDHTYLMTNPANQLVFSAPDKCSETVKYITIDGFSPVDSVYQLAWPMGTTEDVVLFNFRMSTEPANENKYVHMKGHNNGKGEEGAMTTWYNTTNEAGASEWYLQAVDDSLALMLLNDNAYAHDFVVMLEDAKKNAALADDMIRTRLINDPAQMTSPYSQNDLGGKDGGYLNEGVLLDGDVTTFWHSVWSNGSVEVGTHYLQIELEDVVDGTIELNFARRQNQDLNHVTTWGIYGSNQPDGEKFDYEWIADVKTPYTESGERLAVTFDIELGKDYQYLRFYNEESVGNHGYFHLSEFQLYALQENSNNQAAHLGSLYTDLVQAIEVASKVDVNAVSKSDYEALKHAYDAFMARFVDPTALREAIENTLAALRLVEVGNNPGQWSQQTVDEMERQLTEAREYDRLGQYAQDQSDALTLALVDANVRVLAAANGVSADKYYTFRFASEDKYEQMGWGTGNVLNEQLGNLYDTYVAPAESETLEALDAQDVRQGVGLFFTDNKDADIAFRFIPVGEGQYVIQHQASGLYLHVYDYDSWTTLNLFPSLFTVEAIGYGENLIHAVDYKDKDLANLHAQLSGHRLVTWHDTKAGTNSGLIIEEVEDITVAPGSPLADYQVGEVTTLCYPVAVGISAGDMYTVAGTYQSDDKSYVALNHVSQAEAGQPVVLVNEGAYEEVAEGETPELVTSTLIVGTDINTAPRNEGALQGVFESIDLESDVILFQGRGCVMSDEESRHISAGHAYLAESNEVDANAQWDLVIELGGGVTAIHSVMEGLARQGNIYNAAGQLVRKGGLSDLRSLGSGLYILNGTKVLVK